MFDQGMLLMIMKYFTNFISTSSALSLFTDMSSRFSINELMDRVTQSEEFMTFIEQNKDKSGKQVTKKFIKNSIYSFLDDGIDEFVNDKELNDVFGNESLSDDDKFKVFVGKMVVKFFTSGGTGMTPQSLGEIPQFGNALNDIMDTCLKIKGDRTVVSPRHFYHMAVSYAANMIMEMYYRNIDALKMNSEEIDSIEPIYDATIRMIDTFNNRLNYKSPHAGIKRRRSEVDNEGKKNPKRPRK